MHRSYSRPLASLAAVRKNAADLHSLVVQLDTVPVREANAIGSRQSTGNLSGEGSHTLQKARHALRLGVASTAGIAMRSGLLLAIGFVTLAGAAAGEDEVAAGLHVYESAEFGKAAAWFQPVCNHNANAAACYWTESLMNGWGTRSYPSAAVPLERRKSTSQRRWLWRRAVRSIATRCSISCWTLPIARVLQFGRRRKC